MKYGKTNQDDTKWQILTVHSFKGSSSSLSQLAYLTPPKIQYQMYLPKYEIVKPNLDDTKYYFMFGTFLALLLKVYSASTPPQRSYLSQAVQAALV